MTDPFILPREQIHHWVHGVNVSRIVTETIVSVGRA
jgi:hypothetical protein